MLFNSIQFILFFIIAVTIYYLVPSKIRYVWLLVASYIFYMSQNTAFVALLLLSTITTYVAGIALYKVHSVAVKNGIVAAVFIINVGILTVIKYTDFVLGIVGSTVRYNLVVPIGISFYTFQALSYIMDSYREKVEPVYNPLRYALYVSYFPSLLSGPINKARDFLPELMEDKKFDLDNIKFGFMKMLWGYFLKLVVAARLSILVDTVYAGVESFSGFSLLVAAMSYLFMLYCDFEGYSSIAIGVSNVLGIRMKENFRQPFYSSSMGELWRRWHISLSGWLREYLYYPLGGNRKGEIRKYINIMIIFIASGLWHGANWTFFIWGILNGLFLVMGNILANPRERIAQKVGLSGYPEVQGVLRRIGVYCLYAFTMIFFASDTVGKALQVIAGIFTRFSIMAVLSGELFSLGLGKINLAISIILVIFVLIIDGYCNKKECGVTDIMVTTPTWIRWVCYLVIVSMILFSANLSGQEFIYSQM